METRSGKPIDKPHITTAEGRWFVRWGKHLIWTLSFEETVRIANEWAILQRFERLCD
jgi:hypothetical protein